MEAAEEEGSERQDCARIVCPECTVAMRMAGGRVKVERMEGGTGAEAHNEYCHQSLRRR